MSFLGKTVSWQAFLPNLSQPISTRLEAVVGSGFEFTDTKQFELSGANLVNVDMDISADRIFYTVDQAAGLFSSTPGFNGYKIADHLGEIAPIRGVSVVSGPSSLPLGEDGVFFSENAIFVDVDGLSFSRGSTIELIVTFGHPEQAETLVPLEIQSLARLYGASFGRMPDEAGLNFWIDAYEEGVTPDQIAQSFLLSPEFAQLFGAPEGLNERDLVEVLYENILNRPGEAEGIEFWVEQVSSGAISRSHMLIEFATSAENVAITGYAEDMARNIAGTEWIIA